MVCLGLLLVSLDIIISIYISCCNYQLTNSCYTFLLFSPRSCCWWWIVWGASSCSSYRRRTLWIHGASSRSWRVICSTNNSCFNISTEEEIREKPSSISRFYKVRCCLSIHILYFSLSSIRRSVSRAASVIRVPGPKTALQDFVSLRR